MRKCYLVKRVYKRGENLERKGFNIEAAAVYEEVFELATDTGEELLAEQALGRKIGALMKAGEVALASQVKERLAALTAETMVAA